MSKATLKKDFHIPLSASLMIIQSLLAQMINDGQRRLLLVVTLQINLIVCMLSDMIDYHAILFNQFSKNVEKFDPNKSISFIISMFES